MMRGSWVILVAAITLLSGRPAWSSIGILECSAVFKARADWIAGTGGNPVTADMMQSRAELAFQIYLDSVIDEKMVRGSKSPEERRDELALALLTRLAEVYPAAVVLPTCMEDKTCIFCSDKLSTDMRSYGR